MRIIHWLFVVKLGCKRMMSCDRQDATHKKNQHADSHYPPPYFAELPGHEPC